MIRPGVLGADQSVSGPWGHGGVQGRTRRGELTTEKVLKYIQDTCLDGTRPRAARAAGWQPSLAAASTQVGLQGVGREPSTRPKAHPKPTLAGDRVLSSFATKSSRRFSLVTQRLTSPFPLCPKCKIITTAMTVLKVEGK